MNDQSSSADEKLDSLLCDWSRRRALDAESLDRLQRRISGAVALTQAGSSPRQGHRAVVAVCAVAACLLVAVFVACTVPNQNVVNLAESPDGRTRLADLWNKTSEVFGSNLEWICDLDGELLLGVNNDTGLSDSSDRVCLSLTLRVFDPVKQTWVNSWMGRITCPSGSSIDFMSADHRATGSIWVQSRPDGRFVVSHWLSWQDHPEVSGSIDGSISSGESQVVADRIMDGRHVQVVQQVWHPGVG